MNDSGREASTPPRDFWTEHRDVWHRKDVLRRVYHDLFRRIRKALVPGTTVELGGGSGNFKEFLPESISVDVRPVPWIDVAADAHALPFRDQSVANLVLVDVLHHLAEPARFLHEAQRVLASGGRLVMVEPAITPVSWFFYRYLHHEDMDLSADPMGRMSEVAARDPYAGNQAIPTRFFRDGLLRHFPGLELRELHYLSLLAFPLSGGFRSWSLVPAWAIRPLLSVEDRLSPVIGKWAGFRLFAVIETSNAEKPNAQRK